MPSGNIHGVGVDLVQVERMRHALERYGERFARRILSPAERAGFATSLRKEHFLAKRFAAKEATVKALGTGFRFGLTLQHIEVHPDRLGRPTLMFSGRAAELIVELGIVESHLSLADERDYAIAFVTLLSR